MSEQPPRKKSERRRRTHVVGVRVDPGTLRDLRRMAADQGRSVAGVLLHAAFPDEDERPNPQAMPEVADEPRCLHVSPSPWGPTQCCLPLGHESRHAYSPSEAS